MYRFIPGFLLGTLTFTAIFLNTLVVGLPLLAAALVKFAVPLAGWRHRWTTVLVVLAESWIRINNAILTATQPTAYELRGVHDPRLRRDGRFLVTSNHQTWSDVLVLQRVFLEQIPFLRFFIKRELIWLPVLGLAWWALDMPFMKRYSSAKLARHPQLCGKDLETTRRACDRFRRGPVSIMNFIEGTRFDPTKRERHRSPYRHLLRPKAGGVAAVLDALSGDLDTIVNVTIVYDAPNPHFWSFLTGKVPRVLAEVTVEQIPAELRCGDYAGDEVYRERFQAWIRELWERKDARLGVLRASMGLPELPPPGR